MWSYTLLLKNQETIDVQDQGWHASYVCFFVNNVLQFAKVRSEHHCLFTVTRTLCYNFRLLNCSFLQIIRTSSEHS